MHVRYLRREMIGPLRCEHSRKPVGDKLLVVGGSGDEIGPPRATCEGNIRNCKTVRHALRELLAEKFKLLG
jgi:hypothetical protein